MSNINKAFCVIILLLSYSVTTNSQPSTAIVTLNQLLHQVEKNSPALLTDSAAIRIKREQAEEVRSNWLPNLKLNYQADVGTSNNVTGPYFGFGIVPSSSGGMHPTNVTAPVGDNLGIAAFDWEVYNFGKYKAENRVANSDINLEQSHFKESKYELEAYTIGNYLLLLRLQDLLGIQYDNIKRNQEIKRSIESLVKSGIKAGIDTSFADAELSKARLNYIEMQNQYRQVQLKLSAVSGLPYKSIVPDTTVEVALLNHPSAWVFSQDTINHPLISYYRSLYQNSLQKEDLVKKQYNPKISLEGAAWGRGSSIDPSNHYGPLSSGYNFDRGNYLVGVGISYNIPDLRRRHLKLNTQKAVTDYTAQKLHEQQEQLSITSKQADEDMQTAINRLEEIPKQLKAANDGYRQKLSLYKNGFTDIIELDAALNLLYRAETDFMQAKYEYTSVLFRKAIAENQVNTILNYLK